jgi:spore coat protein CotH
MQSRFLLLLFSGFLSAGLLLGQIAPLSPPAPEDGVFGLTILHQVGVSLSKAEWDILQTSNGRGGGAGTAGTDYTQADGRLVHVGGGFRGFYPWTHADLRLDGLEIKDAGLRYKGNFSFTQSSGANPFRANFKVKTGLFGGKNAWNGIETLNIHAGVLDPSLMREALAFALFRAAGVPAPRTAYADLTFDVPGLHANAAAGRYLLVENVNRQFLKNALPSGSGLLLKPEGLRGGVQGLGNNWESYVATYRPDREASPREQARVMEFANLVTQTDTALFREKIGKYLDIDEFLRFVAVNAFIVNTDSYLNGSHNFYLYLDPVDERFRFIPWDQDLALGNRGNASLDILRPVNASQRLISLLLDDPEVGKQYRAILKELATSVFSGPAFRKTLDDLERMSPNRAASPRGFIEGRTSAIVALVEQWK